MKEKVEVKTIVVRYKCTNCDHQETLNKNILI